MNFILLKSARINVNHIISYEISEYHDNTLRICFEYGGYQDFTFENSQEALDYMLEIDCFVNLGFSENRGWKVKHD
jgi:hypothetical protein